MSKTSTNGSQAPTTDKFQGGRSSTRWLTATALTLTALIVSATIASATPTKSDPQTPSSADTKTTLTTSNGTKVTPLGSGLVALSIPIWNNDYPLGRSGQGVVGVHADKTQTPKPHLYGLQANLGNIPGWWIWLTGGSPDDQYISGAVEWTYKSSGTTRLKTAVLDLSARPKIYRADHCSELGLRTLPSSSSAAQTIDSLRECNPPEDVPEVDGWQTRTLTFQDPAANPTSKELFFRLEFPACKNPPTNGEPSCSKHIPELDPLTNGFAARMDRLEMILVDDDLPTVTPSGEFYALKDTYIDGKGTYNLKIDADDTGAGIKQIGFDHQGNAVTEGANGARGTVHDHASPCDPAHNTQSLDNRICPQADATNTKVNTNPMPEGNNSFQAWAKDPAENRGTSSFKVKIDRTPPPAPPNPKFLTPEDGIAQIGWDESVDPALIDATPGSGTASYRVRYAQDFTPFSDWKSYPADARVSDWTPEYPVGTWVTLEVVAVDAVGNVSPASSVHGQVIALPPVVTASGAFYDLDDEYINGHGTYAANVSAVDTGSGVRSVSVHEYMVGDQMTSLAPCTTDLLLVETCPREYGADFSVSTTGLAEGAHVFVGKAVDRLGAVGSTEGTRVLVDRTPPPVPSSVAIESFNAVLGSARFGWSLPQDYALADGTPGSGTTHAAYRSSFDGTNWSSWSLTEDDEFGLTSVAVGTVVHVQVASIDEVGNWSQALTQVLTVAQPPARVEIQFIAEDPESDEVAGLSTTLSLAGGSSVTQSTDTQGEAHFAGLVAGSYTLQSVYRGSVLLVPTRTFDVAPGETVRIAISVTVAADYDDLTPAELKICLLWSAQCLDFKKDRRAAYGFAEHIFTGPRRHSDATRANAFQHAYWASLMYNTLSGRGDFDLMGLKEGEPDLAWAILEAHESVQQTKTGQEKLYSDMDRHNNSVGARIGKTRHSALTDGEFCSVIREEARAGNAVKNSIVGPELIPDYLTYVRSRTKRHKDHAVPGHNEEVLVKIVSKNSCYSDIT